MNNGTTPASASSNFIDGDPGSEIIERIEQNYRLTFQPDSYCGGGGLRGDQWAAIVKTLSERNALREQVRVLRGALRDIESISYNTLMTNNDVRICAGKFARAALASSSEPKE